MEVREICIAVFVIELNKFNREVLHESQNLDGFETILCRALISIDARIFSLFIMRNLST